MRELTDDDRDSWAEYHHEYAGPRWRYGLRYRPLGTWNVPDGWILGSDRPHPEYPHGTADWPRRLELGEVTAYELTLVGEVLRS